MPKPAPPLPKSAVDLNMRDPAAQGALSSALQRLSPEVTDTVRQALRAQLHAGYTAGEGQDEIAARLQKVFDATMSRARTISRTEINSAASQGREIQIRRNFGESYEKEWLTARDSRVRHSHAACDGVRIKATETFPNGLTRPHQPGAPARESVNCRCVWICYPTEAATGTMSVPGAVPLPEWYPSQTIQWRPAAKSWLEENPPSSISYDNIQNLKNFLLNDPKVSPATADEIAHGLSAWVGWPTGTQAQKMDRTVARLLGRDPAEEWINDAERASGFFSDETVKLLPRVSAFSQELYRMKWGDSSTVYRGLHAPIFATPSDKYTVALNTLSSWTRRKTLAESWSRRYKNGAMLTRTIKTPEVFAVVGGTEDEVLVISPKAFMDFPSSSVELTRGERQMAEIDEDAVAYPDNDHEDAHWLAILRREKQQKREMVPEEERASFEVQTVICPKRFWSEGEARSWVKAHGYRTDKIDETSTSYRFRQEDPSLFARLRTICLNPGRDAKPEDCRVAAVGGPKK